MKSARVVAVQCHNSFNRFYIRHAWRLSHRLYAPRKFNLVLIYTKRQGFPIETTAMMLMMLMMMEVVGWLFVRVERKDDWKLWKGTRNKKALKKENKKI